MTTKQDDKLQNERKRIYDNVAWLLSEYDWVSVTQTKAQFIEKLKQMVEQR